MITHRDAHARHEERAPPRRNPTIEEMQARGPTTLCATLLAVGALSTACGSSKTTTVTATSSAPASTSTSSEKPAASTSTSQGASGSQGASTTSAPDSGGTSAPSGTRTAPEPAFTGGEAAPGAGAAVALLRARGYTALDPAQYRPGATLGVLIGRADAGSGEQAFFFLGGRFIGTDAKEPSASVELVSQSDSEATLAYPLYRSGDPAGAPSGGRALVHFQLDDGTLQALSPIPPASPGAALSRR